MVLSCLVVSCNRPDVVAGWSDEEVAKRWWQLFPRELKLWMTPARSKQLRSRLSDISW